MPDIFDAEFLKKLEYLYIISRKVFTGRMKAERSSTKRGVSPEFADYRNYSIGDDFRYIDWNAFARLDELLLKLFEEKEDLHIYLLIDVSNSMIYGEPRKLDYAKQVTAALAYIGLANLDRVGITAFADDIVDSMPLTRGKGKIFSALEFLRRLEGNGDTNMERSFRNFIHRVKRRGLVVVISDFFDRNGFTDGLNVLSYQKHDLSMIHIIDVKEARPQLLGDLTLVDMETGRTRPVTINEGRLKRYRKLFNTFCEELERYCIQKEIRFIRTTTQLPFDELILKMFRMGGFLA
jgi:uncharacterized protein (DUF58 family)